MHKISNFIGQEHITKNLLISIKASKIRIKSLDHIMFHGPPGLGKTTVSKLISNELGVGMYSIHGGNLKTQSDILSILTKIKDNDVLFIDEIHSMDNKVEEMFYSIMENGFVDVILGKDVTAKPIRLNLPPFTLIGATTNIGLISKPLNDRFSMTFEFRPYTESVLTKIVLNYFNDGTYQCDNDASKIISEASRGTPRVAKNIISRVKDYMTIYKDYNLNKNKLVKIFKKIEINRLGLTNLEIRYLKYINKKTGSKGIESISLALNTPPLTIKNVVEPFLVRSGLCTRNIRGRTITKYGENYLKSTYYS